METKIFPLSITFTKKKLQSQFAWTIILLCSKNETKFLALNIQSKHFVENDINIGKKKSCGLTHSSFVELQSNKTFWANPTSRIKWAIKIRDFPWALLNSLNKYRFACLIMMRFLITNTGIHFNYLCSQISFVWYYGETENLHVNIAISKSCYLRNCNNDINITRELLIFSNNTRVKFSEIIELFEV